MMLKIIASVLLIGINGTNDAYVYNGNFNGNPKDVNTVESNHYIVSGLLRFAGTVAARVKNDKGDQLKFDAANLLDVLLQINALCTQRKDTIPISDLRDKRVQMIEEFTDSTGLKYHRHQKQALVDMMNDPTSVGLLNKVRDFSQLYLVNM